MKGMTDGCVIRLSGPVQNWVSEDRFRAQSLHRRLNRWAKQVNPREGDSHFPSV